MKLIFATMLTKDSYQDGVLSELGADNRLLSFALLKDLPLEDFQNYIMTGLTRPREGLFTRTGWKHSAYVRKRRILLAKRLQQYLKDPEFVE